MKNQIIELKDIKCPSPEVQCAFNHLLTVNKLGSPGTLKTAQVAGTSIIDYSAKVWIFTSGTGTITLPTPAAINQYVTFTIINNTGADRTISSFTNYAGSATTTITSNTKITVQSDGSAYFQVG